MDTRSSEGDNLRVYVQPIQSLRDRVFFLQVGRSTEPERQALRRLLYILIGTEGIGILLALTGGFFLAGRALAPIRQAMDAQRAFVADASHELRTPLSLIRANAELLKRQPSKPVRENMASVDDIIQETDRLNALVGQMLTLARAEADQATLNLTEVDLGQLVPDTSRQMQGLAESRRIAVNVPASGPVKVLGDPLRLRELLVIVLDNAIKYSDPDTVVRVSLEPLTDKVQVQVADSGWGIPPEALPHIFERFYRVDKARSREMGGTGLGLAIAKWIVDSHKGTINVESTPGKGTMVTVVLPLLGS